MKIGTLLRNNETPSVIALVTKEPYSKPVWGSSGHPEDIAVVTFMQIRRNNGVSQILKLSTVQRTYTVVSVPKVK
tara:strand:+ start:416 stop:640 length:225 start_codon:yes stop_codon:yes gene_type:complete